MAEVSSFLRVSTPASVNDVDQRDLETICSLVLLEDPNFFFFFFCKISKYLKSASILLNTVLAKQHTRSECLRRLLMWQCCAAQILSPWPKCARVP